jgi:hypothetical protein
VGSAHHISGMGAGALLGEAVRVVPICSGFALSKAAGTHLRAPWSFHSGVRKKNHRRSLRVPAKGAARLVYNAMEGTYQVSGATALKSCSGLDLHRVPSHHLKPRPCSRLYAGAAGGADNRADVRRRLADLAAVERQACVERAEEAFVSADRGNPASMLRPIQLLSQGVGGKELEASEDGLHAHHGLLLWRLVQPSLPAGLPWPTMLVNPSHAD